MTTKRITAALVEALQPGETVWDAEVRGFGCRMQVRERVYLVKARVGARQRILTIGQHGRGYWGPESARREAVRLLGLIRDGRDLATERDAAKVAPMLEALAARYLAEYAAHHKKPRTIAEDERLLKLHILPKLGRVRVRDIDKATVARFHSAMSGKPVAGNRALALLSAIMGWAEKHSERPDGTTPCRHVDRYEEKARERLVTAAELARLGEALDNAAEAWTPARRAARADACPRQAEAAGIPQAERRAWIEARMPAREMPEDWRAIHNRNRDKGVTAGVVSAFLSHLRNAR